MKLYEFILMEARAEALASKYEAKILSRTKQDRSGEIIIKVLPFLQQLESQFGKAVEWVLLKWLQGDFLIEDLPRVKTAIDQFEQKKRGLEKKDINQYKTLLDLEDATGLLDDVKSNRQKKQEIKSEGVKIIANNERIFLAQLLTEESAKFYGKNTKWCTSAAKYNQFANYDSDGPIYFLLDKGTNEKYQIHYQSYSCMDALDQPHDYQLLLRIAPELNQIEPTLKELQKGDEFDLTAYLTTFHAGARWEREEYAIAKNPELALYYAQNVIRGRFPEGEDSISTDYYCAYEYAQQIIGRRWEKGEDAIATSAVFSCRYAKYILKDRFLKGEVAIAQDPKQALFYAQDIIKGRFPAGEEIIGSSARFSYMYAKNVIKGRFLKGETAIAKRPDDAYWYAKEVIKGRWPEAEHVIASDPEYACLYASGVIEGRWPEAEDVIASDPRSALSYAKNIIEGRWPEAEGIISGDDRSSYYYNNIFGTNL